MRETTVRFSSKILKLYTLVDVRKRNYFCKVQDSDIESRKSTQKSSKEATVRLVSFRCCLERLNNDIFS